MHYSPQELAQWATVEDLLAPHGAVDQDAIALYLTQYARANTGENKGTLQPQEATLLGTIAKHATLDNLRNAFSPFYAQLRFATFEGPLDENGSSTDATFDDWLQGMALSRPADLEILLRHAGKDLGVTHQAMVLRDAYKWLPQSNMASYIAPNFLEKQSASLFKDFSPAITQVPYLIEVGAALRDKSLSPEHQATGDTLLRNCFFYCYEQRRQPNRESKVFDALGAFKAIEDHALIDDHHNLLKQLYKRIKKPTVGWDALDYCVATMEDPTASAGALKRAETLVHGVLEMETSEPLKGRYTRSASRALVRIYEASTNETLKAVLLDFFDTHIHANRKTPRFFMEFLESVPPQHVPEQTPALLAAIVERMKAKAPPDEWDAVISTLALSDVEHRGRKVETPHYDVDPPPVEAGQWFFSQLDGAQTTHHLGCALRYQSDSHGTLGHLLHALVQRRWTSEQESALRGSLWAPTAILLYFYLRANDSNNAHYLEANALPAITWWPLPFLKKLYPEHAPLWRTMQLDVLKMAPVQNQSNDVDFPDALRQSQAIMRHCFDMFAQAFIPEPINFDTCKGIVQSLEIAPLEYLSSKIFANPEPMFELPKDMFDSNPG